VLRLERGHATQQQLATRPASIAGASTGWRMGGAGRRRRASGSLRALRPGDSLRDRVAVDERLRQAAGRSLMYANTRPHVASERVRAELLAEAAGGPVATEADNFGALQTSRPDQHRPGDVTDSFTVVMLMLTI